TSPHRRRPRRPRGRCRCLPRQAAPGRRTRCTHPASPDLNGLANGAGSRYSRVAVCSNMGEVPVRKKRTPFGSVSGGRRGLRVRALGAALALVAGLALALTPADSAADSGGVSISYSIDGIAGTNGWYRGSTHGNFVVLKWFVTDPNSQVIDTSGCSAVLQIPGPQVNTTRTCVATLAAGGTVSAQTKPIYIDADPPTGVAAGAARPPDANGWYNHPVAVGWQGSDATSGIAGCTSLTFPGPGLDAASLGGICTDNAGNTAAGSFSLQYDATPPAVS